MRLSAIALKRRQWEPFAFATPALILIAVVIVFPLIYSFYLSLRDFDLSVGPDSTFVGARNYGEALLRDDPHRAWSKADLARAAGVSPKGGIDEHVAGFVRIGLVEPRDRGYALADPPPPYVPSLKRLLVQMAALPDAS